MMNRRKFLLMTGMMPFVSACTVAGTAGDRPVASAKARLARLEFAANGRLGVYAVDTDNEMVIRYRANERFPMCSTFKVMLAGAILARSAQDNGFLQTRIRYNKHDLVTYSPITEKHTGDGMTIAELCAAALQYSDNTAGNLLIKILGGPSAVTAYARSIGNDEFRLDRWETELNSCIPGDPRDTVTPAAMALSLRSLTLGDALPVAQKKQLNAWMEGNTTGARRIRTAVPADWKVGDKTGSGDYGTANDIAVIYPPDRKPMVVAVYFTHADKNAKWRDDVIANAAQLVVDRFKQGWR